MSQHTIASKDVIAWRILTWRILTIRFFKADKLALCFLTLSEKAITVHDLVVYSEVVESGAVKT